MRRKKLRGHKRRWKQIDKWKSDSLGFNMDYFKKYNADYKEVLIHPWCDFVILNSTYPFPNKKTKRKMIQGLVEIYDAWKVELEKLGKPYYLKIWLKEPRIQLSQVVCAVGGNVNFYNETFHKVDLKKGLNTHHYGALKESMEQFEWDSHLDEDHFDNTQVGDVSEYSSYEEYKEYKFWFEKKLKKPHRKHKFKVPIGDVIESYSFKRGYVWIGEKK